MRDFEPATDRVVRTRAERTLREQAVPDSLERELRQTAATPAARLAATHSETAGDSVVAKLVAAICPEPAIASALIV